MHFVYILYNIITLKFYIGEINNINKRIEEHRTGENRSTKYKCYGWKLVYAEIYRSREDAILREQRLKPHGSGMIKIKKRIKNSVNLAMIKAGEGLIN